MADSRESSNPEPLPDRITRYWCPRHGATASVVGMGTDRAPLCAEMVGHPSHRHPCREAVERVIYERAG